MLKFLKKSGYSTLAALLLIFNGCAIINSNANSAKEEFRNSVVQISTTTQTPFFYSPWIWHPPRQLSGQGIVVGKNLVLTIASVVKNAKQIEMTMNSEPVPTPMKLVAIDMNANLALLRGNLPENAKPIDIPERSDFTRGKSLNLYWKTSNGKIIEGNAVLDSVKTRYNFDSFQGLAMFQALKSSHPNIGYGIPVFDADNDFYGLSLRNGKYSFYIITCNTIRKAFDLKKGSLKEPTAVAGFNTAPLTQTFFRQKLGLSPDSGGCLISKVFGQGSGHDQLQEGDVLLSVCGKKLDPWGRYEDPEYGTMSYPHLFSEHYVSEKFPVTIVRDKKKQTLNLALSSIDDTKWLIPTNPGKKPAEYLVRGGFVFVPLTKTYLTEWGAGFVNQAPMNLVCTFNENRYLIKAPEKKEFVILSRVLSHPTNIGLQSINNMIVEKVDDKPLKSLKELSEILNNRKKDVVKLTLAPGNIPLLLSKKVLESADMEIQDYYGIGELQQINQPPVCTCTSAE